MFNRFFVWSGKWQLILVAGIALILSGCGSELSGGSSSSGSDSDSSSSKNAFFEDDDETIAVQVLDATDPNSWVYYDLDTFTVVQPDDPENDVVWDIAFKRFVIKVNGGVSGIGGVEIASQKNSGGLQESLIKGVQIPEDAVFVTDRGFDEVGDEELLTLGNNIFFSVCAPGYDDEDSDNFCLDFDNKTIDRDHLNPNEAAYAFLTQGSGMFIEKDGTDASEDGELLGWYDYWFYENHLLRPADDTYIIRTSSGNTVILEMIGYYGYQEGDSESGTMAFRYASLDSDFAIPQPGVAPLSIGDIRVSAQSGTAPLKVSFTIDAEGVDGTAQYAWDFDRDGVVDSTEKNPEFTFDEVGAHVVFVTVTDDRGSKFAQTEDTTINVKDTNSGSSDDYEVVQVKYADSDTYSYGLTGNQGATDGDSGGVRVWNHETNHGGQALIDFGTDVFDMVKSLGSGNYKVEMRLYATCVTGGFIQSCPGFPKSGGVAITTTDVKLFDQAWTEDGDLSMLTWNYGPNATAYDPAEVEGETYISFSQDGSEFVDDYGSDQKGGWITVDLTDLYEYMVEQDDGSFTFLLTQENYPVVRDDGYNAAVSIFCDSESTTDICDGGNYAPRLVVSEKSD